MTCGSWHALLDRRWRQAVFSLGSRQYDWLDVFLSAMIRGEWAAYERRLTEGLAWRAEAESAGAWPSDDRINEAAAQFRYDRDLLTTEETHAWLAQHQITVDEWIEYLVRELIRDGDIPVEAALARHRSSLDLDAAFASDGLCSGEFHRFATACAGHAAVSVRRRAGLPDDAPEPQVERIAAAHQAWLAALDPGDVTTRLARLIEIEGHFRTEAAAAVTDEAVAIQLARHRAEWTRVHLERISFRSIDAAREATWCVREDGLTLRDVAAVSRQRLRSTSEFLEQLEPVLRDALLSAAVGELIGPIRAESGFEVAFVADKAVAQLDHPAVRARAEQEVVEQMMSQAVLTEVRWIEPRG